MIKFFSRHLGTFYEILMLLYPILRLEEKAIHKKHINEKLKAL